jgi:hypothetical protein
VFFPFSVLGMVVLLWTFVGDNKQIVYDWSSTKKGWLDKTVLKELIDCILVSWYNKL